MVLRQNGNRIIIIEKSGKAARREECATKRVLRTIYGGQTIDDEGTTVDRVRPGMKTIEEIIIIGEKRTKTKDITAEITTKDNNNTAKSGTTMTTVITVRTVTQIEIIIIITKIAIVRIAIEARIATVTRTDTAKGETKGKAGGETVKSEAEIERSGGRIDVPADGTLRRRKEETIDLIIIIGVVTSDAPRHPKRHLATTMVTRLTTRWPWVSLTMTCPHRLLLLRPSHR